MVKNTKTGRPPPPPLFPPYTDTKIWKFRPFTPSEWWIAIVIGVASEWYKRVGGIWSVLVAGDKERCGMVG